MLYGQIRKTNRLKKFIFYKDITNFKVINSQITYQTRVTVDLCVSIFKKIHYHYIFINNLLFTFQF